MGGNSFPETQRLSESEYTRICQLITKYLTKIGVEHRIPVEVLDKAEICAVRGMTEPYGDVDVIVAQQNEVCSPLTNFTSFFFGNFMFSSALNKHMNLSQRLIKVKN